MASNFDCDWTWRYRHGSAIPHDRMLAVLPNEADPLDLIPAEQLVDFCRTFEAETNAVEQAYLAAVAWAEGSDVWQLPIAAKPFEWRLPCFPSTRLLDLLALPVVEVSEVSVSGTPVDGWELDRSRYIRLTADRWPDAVRTDEDTYPVRIEFTAGYKEELPPSLEQAIKLLTNHFYTTRGAMVPQGILNALRQWRRLS